MADYGVYPSAIVSIEIETGTQAYWDAYNPILGLKKGAFALDTGILKIGNGQQRYEDLVAFEADMYVPKHANQHGKGSRDPITPLAIDAADRNHTHASSQITDLYQVIKHTIENDDNVHIDADTVAGSNPSVSPVSNSVVIRTILGTVKTTAPKENDDSVRFVDLNGSVSTLRNEMSVAITNEHNQMTSAINNIATSLRSETGNAITNEHNQMTAAVENEHNSMISTTDTLRNDLTTAITNEHNQMISVTNNLNTTLRDVITTTVDDEHSKMVATTTNLAASLRNEITVAVANEHTQMTNTVNGAMTTLREEINTAVTNEHTQMTTSVNNMATTLRGETTAAVNAEHTAMTTAVSNATTTLRNETNTAVTNLQNSTTAALGNKEDKSNKGTVNGYASLNENGNVPISQLPYVLQSLYDKNTRTLVLLTVGSV